MAYLTNLIFINSFGTKRNFTALRTKRAKKSKPLLSFSCRKRNDTSIKEVEKKRSASQEILGKLQQQYQQFLTKMAAKA